MEERLGRLDSIGALDSQADNSHRPRVRIDRSALAALKNGEPCPLVADFNSPPSSSADVSSSVTVPATSGHQSTAKEQHHQEQPYFPPDDLELHELDSDLTPRDFRDLSDKHNPAVSQFWSNANSRSSYENALPRYLLLT